MPRRRPNPEESPIGEANVLPVLNIMFLLIPALLLAMEVASMAAIAITPPNLCAQCSKPGDSPKTEPLELEVRILADGFRVSSAAQQIGAEAGRAQDSGQPTVPLARPDAPADDYDRYNYVALEDLARDFKRKYPNETTVKVSAEGDIPAQVLVHTLDALRGIDCKPSTVELGDGVPDECLFFYPVVHAI